MKVYLNEKIKPNLPPLLLMDWDSVVPKQTVEVEETKRRCDMTMTQWFPKLAEYDYDG